MTTDASRAGNGSGQQDAMVDAPSCGAAGEACCASNVCSADLTCTTADQTCRASLLFVGGSRVNQTTAYVARGSWQLVHRRRDRHGKRGFDLGYSPRTTSGRSASITTAHQRAEVVRAALERHDLGDGDSVHAGWFRERGSGATRRTTTGHSRMAAARITGPATTWGSLQPIDNGQVFTATWGASATNMWAFATNRMSHYDGAWTTSTRSDFTASRRAACGRPASCGRADRPRRKQPGRASRRRQHGHRGAARRQ